ncbi:hypothetical protein SPI_07858 [Niveomyces insectorum RCEF 264]|uniref:Uncharacterized protein n=1 Tax=Niveomyces insectorum RCEF 264 TaxID=1081102 RepID=A0A167P3E9_9HYPO|nr:hypothetical protein SPI_07858 [Niveomyces insectorum RCEF 264]
MPVPIAAFSTFPNAAENLTTHLKPEYDVVHVSTSKEAALSELPALFSGGNAPKALIFAGPTSDEDAAAISSAVTGASSSARIVRLTREDLEAAGVPLPPPGAVPGPPPPGAPRPDPEVFTRLFKQKLAGL